MRLEIHDGSNWGDDGDTTPTICTMNADGSCGPPRLMIQSFGKDKAAEELAEQIVKAANLHERLVEAFLALRGYLLARNNPDASYHKMILSQFECNGESIGKELIEEIR